MIFGKLLKIIIKTQTKIETSNFEKKNYIKNIT